MENKLTCIIIDDEKKDRENLRLLLNSYCPEITVLDEAHNKRTILSVLEKHSPDIVFFDIQLGNISIFDILNELKNIYFNIVFVSAYDKYAIKGYQYNAIDYLLKPVKSDRLKDVIKKINIIKNTLDREDTFKSDYKKLQSRYNQSSKISVTDSRGIHLLSPKEILYCMSDGNYTTLYLINDKKMVISKNLKHFENLLLDFNFFRIYRSYLINLHAIDFVLKEDGGSVVMKNGNALPISRTVKKEFFNKLRQVI
ncbi:LytTR family DNA-binding domain-containing protein [Flavivirga amylovorans]|uniref:LytTR family DNA-binding domain-containing protein n=1 Tax=Flavivirga amylovorans TaxID=870486 RepID=A0ABT8WWE1_9FLAO|nr:LytTR family DNA-binding domain-containing protein [Flavivirga amylovorans]MDO5985793.1 LytTR family DNA-binding domain-containing protein [Flavivirga amylovorans]